MHHSETGPAPLTPGNTEATPHAHTSTGHLGEIFDSRKSFADLGVRNSVLTALEAMGFKQPTAIQAQLIPVALSGKDVLGQAKTGTGKTAAFAIPLLCTCQKDVPFQALILAPTRELAIQITSEIDDLGRNTPIHATTVYGGQRVAAQATKLKTGSEIIVGTPGRVMDMLERGLLHFRNIKFAVLDEVDRMFDIGFRDDIRRILEQCPKERQTIFVSATISKEIEALARRHMREPEKIVTSAGSLTVSLVKQKHLTVNPWDKKRLLVHLLTHEEPALTIVFCRLKRTVDELTRLLNHKGIEAHAIHGDMPQGKRNTTMAKLRSGQLAVLVASDLASRGIDVDGISHVINYDLPDDPDLYVHRIGRTARAGREGVAWALVTPSQGDLLTQIEVLINAEIPKLDYPDFQPSERPEGFREESRGGRPPVIIEGGDVQKTNRLAASVNRELPPAQSADPSKFPGGLIPTKMPPKRLHGKIPGRGR
ncbi:MAG: DEAD/DEAH box helicase [Phycisphaerales bacterium]|nr:DEAD/DEAH box helicase [Phycisphaerales bacterium]